MTLLMHVSFVQSNSAVPEMSQVKQKTEWHFSLCSDWHSQELVSSNYGWHFDPCFAQLITSYKLSPLCPGGGGTRWLWSSLWPLCPLGLAMCSGSPSPLPHLTLFPLLCSYFTSWLSRRVEEGTCGGRKWLPWQRCPAIPLHCGCECVTPSPGWTSPCRWGTTSLSPTAGSTSR